MELKQLESFVAVVKYGSFTKAAEALFISQPSISSHLRALETSLDTTLLIRTTKSLRVTPPGYELYDWACQLLRDRDHLMARWQQADAKEIHIEASTIPSTYFLPRILPEFCRRYPHIPFTIRQSVSHEVIEHLRHGDNQVGFTGLHIPDEALAYTPVMTDTLVLITPPSEAFRDLPKTVETADSLLAKNYIILRSKGSGSLDVANTVLDALPLDRNQLKLTAHISDPEAIKNLVVNGLGVSIISETAVDYYRNQGRLLTFPLPDEVATRYLYLVYRKHDTLSSYVRAFIEYVNEISL